jgi:hypothetical protein
MRDMDWDLGFGLKWFNAQFSRTQFNAESFGMRFSVSASDGSGGGARDVPIPHPRAAFTPQRCCSVAYAVFFEYDAPAGEKAPQRPGASAARAVGINPKSSRPVQRV